MKRIVKSTFIALALLVVAVGCNDESGYISEPQVQELDLYESIKAFDQEIEYEEIEGGIQEDGRWRKRRVRKRTTFFTLTTALVKTGLVRTVIQNELTIFAPSDAAFAKLGLNARNIGSVPNLKEILLYHVVGGKVRSFELTEGFVPTANGAAVEVSLNDGVFVKGAENKIPSQVIKADLHALNGVFHIIDQVLLPPTQNIVEIAAGNDDFSILVEAVAAAGLVDALSGDTQLTVFAPTNEAFVNLLGEIGLSKDELFDNIPLLQAVLLYHVTEGRVYSSDLLQDLVVPTLLSGQSVTVDLGALQLVDGRERRSNLVGAALNIQATNGVIHVIDKVILPAE